MLAYAVFWRTATETAGAAATPLDRVFTLATRVSRHPNVLAYLLTSSGVGFSAVQFLAWLKGIEVVDHLAYSAEHLVAVQTEQMEETMDVGFDVIRDGVQNLAWWSRVITTLVMLRLIFWVIVGRNFTL